MRKPNTEKYWISSAETQPRTWSDHCHIGEDEGLRPLAVNRQDLLAQLQAHYAHPVTPVSMGNRRDRVSQMGITARR